MQTMIRRLSLLVGCCAITLGGDRPRRGLKAALDQTNGQR
jgi:hypothetical protein